MHWPRFLTKWSEENFVKQLLLQHDVDIKRLWKRMPQTPEVGGPGGAINIGGHVPGTSGASAGTGQTGDTGGSVSSASAIVEYPALAKAVGAIALDLSGIAEVYVGTPGAEVTTGKRVRVFNKTVAITNEQWLFLNKINGHVYAVPARCS